jgi:hypothetical protein
MTNSYFQNRGAMWEALDVKYWLLVTIKWGVRLAGGRLGGRSVVLLKRSSDDDPLSAV